MTIALPDLLLYCGALVILFLTPGPVWLAIMARALSGGFGAAWPLALGVAIGDMLWPLVAVLGISWILSVFDMFMLGMRWIACAVFLIMGVLLPPCRRQDRPRQPSDPPRRMGRFRCRVAGHSGQPKGRSVLYRCAAGLL